MLRGRRSPPREDAPPSPRDSEYGASEPDEPEPPDVDDDDDVTDAPRGVSGGGWVRGGGGSAHGCSECDSLSVDARLLAAFGARLCDACKRLPAHALVTKSTAKTTYLLSDADLAKLGCIKKRNASYTRDGETHLFLASQVAAAAAARHGGADALAAERDRRRDARLARAAKRRRTAAEAADGGDEAAAAALAADDAVAAALLGRGRGRGGAKAGRGAGAPAAVRKLAAAHAPHTHTYTGPPLLHAANGEHRRVCATCGAVSVVEVL